MHKCKQFDDIWEAIPVAHNLITLNCGKPLNFNVCIPECCWQRIMFEEPCAMICSPWFKKLMCTVSLKLLQAASTLLVMNQDITQAHAPREKGFYSQWKPARMASQVSVVVPLWLSNSFCTTLWFEKMDVLLGLVSCSANRWIFNWYWQKSSDDLSIRTPNSICNGIVSSRMPPSLLAFTTPLR